MRSGLGAVFVFVFASLAASCQQAKTCDSSTCAGCCASGECVQAPSGRQCGVRGSACVECPGNGAFCNALGLCGVEVSGGGGGATGGGTGGGAGGGGGSDAGSDAGACATCRAGEFCVEDGGAVTCLDDYDAVLRPYCDACSGQTCGAGPNFCLSSGASSACGVDCSRGQSCPIGYTCQDVMVVAREWSCSAASPCPPNPTLPCGTSMDCRVGSQCVSGFCAPPCLNGFCGCQVDTDCVQETCAAGQCSITRLGCVTETNCRPIRCVASGDAGACLIGANCSPAPGLTCADVK